MKQGGNLHWTLGGSYVGFSNRRDETEEFSLINKYNAFALGLSTDEADKQEYEDYLTEVLSIKAMVKVDLQAETAE